MRVEKFVLYSATGTFAFNVGVAWLVYYGKTHSVYRFVFDAASAALGALVRYSVSYPLSVVLIVSIVALGSLLVYRYRP